MSDLRVMPAVDERVETGPTRFGDDWAGIFIRGDNAFYYAYCLSGLLSGEADVFQRAAVEDLLKLLQGCNERFHPEWREAEGRGGKR